MSQFFELPPAGPNPPYGPGDYAGCCVAVCADFITAYTSEKITDLSALGASMGQRHRNVDPSCRHGIAPTAWCGYCIFLECHARGLPVAYQQLTWTQIAALATAGKYVAVSGLYSRIGYVAPSSYSPTVPSRGRSDTFTGAHEIALIGMASGRFKVLDPDYGNSRGTPPYSLLDAGQVQAFFSSLGYAVCFASKAPGGASSSHEADVTTATAIWNPGEKRWVYNGKNRLKAGTVLTVRGATYMVGTTPCYPVQGPTLYTGYLVPKANVRLLT